MRQHHCQGAKARVPAPRPALPQRPGGVGHGFCFVLLSHDALATVQQTEVAVQGAWVIAWAQVVPLRGRSRRRLHQGRFVRHRPRLLIAASAARRAPFLVARRAPSPPLVRAERAMPRNRVPTRSSLVTTSALVPAALYALPGMGRGRCALLPTARLARRQLSGLVHHDCGGLAHARHRPISIPPHSSYWSCESML